MWKDWDDFAPEATFGMQKPKAYAQKQIRYAQKKSFGGKKPKLKLGGAVKTATNSYRFFRPTLEQKTKAMETKAIYLKRKQIAEDKLKGLLAEERKRAHERDLERQEKIKTAFNKAKYGFSKAKGFAGKVFNKKEKSIYE